MFGIIGTWMEEDIVAATIRNAQTQGCERVYLVDNESPDNTVATALSEGAILARSFSTEYFDEDTRVGLMNEVVAEISDRESGTDHIWWLFMDADEFPHGPSGVTLRQYINALDMQFRVVGSRFFDHYPTDPPYYVKGLHPLDFQPLCVELAVPMCPSWHRKHSLIRYDRQGPPIRLGNGLHLAFAGEPLYEPAQPVFLHHFPYRVESATRARLERLWSRNAEGYSRAHPRGDTHMLARYLSLDAVYERRWGDVLNFLAIDPMRTPLGNVARRGVTPRPFADLVSRDDQRVMRWYDHSAVVRLPEQP
jgi:glycosyltransferase involved in cell wall biosynthesis